MTGSPAGQLALVLHAHLPFVRHPEHPVFLEENWLFEAMVESYIPLVDMLGRLREDGIEFRLGLGLSPTLCEMLSDDLLQERFAARLDALIELSRKELDRTQPHPEFHRTAVLYNRHFERAKVVFEETFGRDLLSAFRAFQEAGALEIICCPATHAFLPLLVNRRAIRAQLRMGIRNYRRHFGCDPRGLWLPECAYVPGLDEELAAEHLRYFFLDSHGILFGTPRPKYGIFAPVLCRSRVAAFGRDIESSKQVWSSQTGYPGDADYREFYRDLGYDADYDYIAPYLHPDGIRHDVGIKYHRVTGAVALSDKQPYNPERARAKVDRHATDFLVNRQKQARHLRELLGRPPLIVAPYDAELFGHWWYEGPQFLELFLRKAACDQEDIELVTPSGYLEQQPSLQVVEPSASSWGDKGYFEVWLNGSNDWIYRHLHKAEERMAELADANGQPGTLRMRALNQAARELMLAESSDWAFIMSTGTMVSYAEKRVHDHIRRFNELYDMLTNGSIAEPRLAELEQRDNIFPDMDYRIYAV